MKLQLTLLVVVLSTVTCGVVAGPSESVDDLIAQECAESIRFIRHAKSQLCFATCWVGSGYGGPGLTLVPDEHCAKGGAQ